MLSQILQKNSGLNAITFVGKDFKIQIQTGLRIKYGSRKMVMKEGNLTIKMILLTLFLIFFLLNFEYFEGNNNLILI